ncbi:Hypothetical predicted protein [Olea europaea subsp. europaea]|uniref:Uncharacterized protein n=1 Tax=Olea europaea subsp. europaea TaxID=158383 RepID=A0A8S0U879_OLEEU|nr:Hypothetical predicted protein [Olea europaea subsp. europaea]
MAADKGSTNFGLLTIPRRISVVVRDVSICRSLLRDESILHLTFPPPSASNVRASSPRRRSRTHAAGSNFKPYNTIASSRAWSPHFHKMSHALTKNDIKEARNS